MGTYRTGKLQSGEIDKIDDLAVDGLSGVKGSLAYSVNEILDHLHGMERWYGSDGDNTSSTVNGLTEFQCTAGTGEVFGSEVQIMGSNDVTSSDFGFTPTYFNIHRVLLTAASANDKNYILQFWGGETTFGDATLLGEVPYRKGATVTEILPMPIRMERIPVSYKVWARIKCVTNSATLDFIIGLHGYIG